MFWKTKPQHESQIRQETRYRLTYLEVSSSNKGTVDILKRKAQHEWLTERFQCLTRKNKVCSFYLEWKLQQETPG